MTRICQNCGKTAVFVVDKNRPAYADGTFPIVAVHADNQAGRPLAANAGLKHLPGVRWQKRLMAKLRDYCAKKPPGPMIVKVQISPEGKTLIYNKRQDCTWTGEADSELMLIVMENSTIQNHPSGWKAYFYATIEDRIFVLGKLAKDQDW